MNLDNFINNLEGVKRTGQNRIVARCPAHNDKSPSLSVSQVDDRILIHCFAGCAVADVLAAIGLNFDDLFPEKPSQTKPHPAKFNPYDILRCLRDEAMIILIAANHCATSQKIDNNSLLRVELAHSRIQDACGLVWGRK